MFMEKPYLVYAQALTDSLLLHISKGRDHGRTGGRPRWDAR